MCVWCQGVGDGSIMMVVTVDVVLNCGSLPMGVCRWLFHVVVLVFGCVWPSSVKVVVIVVLWRYFL